MEAPKNSGWTGFLIMIVVYTVVISGFAFSNNVTTNRNKADIEKQDQIHRDDMKRMEGLILEGFKELRREINAIK